MNINQVVNLLIKYRIWLLSVCLVLAVAGWVPSRQLEFERSIENLFRQDDPRYDTYRLDKRLFGGVETAIVAYDDAKLFTEDGLTRLVEFQQRLAEVDGVSRVTSLNDVRRPSALLESRKLVDQVRQNQISVDKLKKEILGTDLYRDRLVSADGLTALLLVELESAGAEPRARANTIERLMKTARENQPAAFVLGGPVLVEEIFATLEDDGVLLGVASSLILMVVIAVLFRSLRWTLLPLLVVHVSLIWTKAIVAFSGMKLTMVSAQLVAMVTVIGVATSVHIMVRYREERTTSDVEHALRRTLCHIAPAIFWTCLTTAAGFAALFASTVTPFQSFAFMMSLGSMLVFFSAMMLIPAAALMFRAVDNQLGHIPTEGLLAGMLSKLTVILNKHPGKVVIVVACILAICSVGSSRLTVATDFSNNFRQSSSILQSYYFLKKRLPSLDTMNLLVPVKGEFEQGIDEAMTSIKALQQELETDSRVVNTVSFVDLLDFLDESLEQSGSAAGSGFQRWLPAVGKMPAANRLLLLQSVQPGLMASFLNREQKTARIIVQLAPIRGSTGKKELIENVESVSREHFESAEVAGFYVLMASVVQSLLADQWTTFGLSILAIFVIMSIAFRSIGLGLIAMVPNASPIFVVLGTMGWLGLEINMATAMMASVSMGLSVDFSIHYLYRFRQEINQGSDFFKALAEAHGSVGLAMIIANFALIAGFLSLTLSALIPSVHFGLMVSVTMLGGLMGNLVILPLLLRLLWVTGWISAAKVEISNNAD